MSGYHEKEATRRENGKETNLVHQENRQVFKGVSEPSEPSEHFEHLARSTNRSERVTPVNLTHTG